MSIAQFTLITTAMFQFSSGGNSQNTLFWRNDNQLIQKGEYSALTGHWFWTPLVRCGCNATETGDFGNYGDYNSYGDFNSYGGDYDFSTDYSDYDKK